MTPEREAAQAKGQTATQFRFHGNVFISRIATPMQWVTLAACPRATCPDDILVVGSLGNFGHCFVVAQRIEIMFVPTATTGCVDTFQWCCFAKVYLDSSNAHFQQSGQFILIPFHGVRIREIEHCIFVGHFAFRILYIQILVNDFRKKFILWCKISQLP